ncbi:hypothetical protein [Bacillus sp. AFS019443]|uniref:hypothetical protein n=1 Tax=Bacillus sp. AFS019443 TaxID=2034279 RepID=UPI000BF7C0C2|nr:hypothetical protein [Bacillus sp. AFS019443]PEU16115.1 hypothetical protein CN524_05050 [Bacillus sp. AFS019443]
MAVALFGLASVALVVVFLIMGIISVIKKNGKAKRNFGFTAGAFVLFVILANIPDDGSEAASTSPQKEAPKQEVKKEVDVKETQEQKKAREEAEAKNTAEVEAQVKQTTADRIEKEKIRLSGHGTTSSDPIQLKKGFAILEVTNSNSDSNFIVQLQNQSGKKDMIFNEIGNYQGKSIVEIPTSGEYYLDIQTDGDWNFTISQELPVDIPKAPTQLSGSRGGVVFVEMKKGLHKITATHANGDSNFIVQQVNGGGIVFNEIGNYNGSKREMFKDDGVYGFKITADGDWTLNIE